MQGRGSSGWIRVLSREAIIKFTQISFFSYHIDCWTHSLALFSKLGAGFHKNPFLHLSLPQCTQHLRCWLLSAFQIFLWSLRALTGQIATWPSILEFMMNGFLGHLSFGWKVWNGRESLRCWTFHVRRYSQRTILISLRVVFNISDLKGVY